MTEKRDAIVQVSVPFCVDDRALRREGMILGWDSARMARYADALVAEIEANAGQFDDCLCAPCSWAAAWHRTRARTSRASCAPCGRFATWPRTRPSPCVRPLRT